MQVNFAVKELREEYTGLWAFLCSTDDLYLATRRVCIEFEGPAGTENPNSKQCNDIVNYRYREAQKYMTILDNHDIIDDEELSNNTFEKFWPPRTIDVGMQGPDVGVWQFLLICYGYVTNVTGEFSQKDREETKKLQAQLGTTPDGIPGPNTWKAAVKM